MSLKAMEWAFGVEDERLTPVAKFVLLAIADKAHEQDNYDCWVKHETISRKVNMSIDTVQRRVNDLANLGYIHVIRRRGPDGRQISNRYIVLVDEKAKLHALAHGWAIREAGRGFEKSALDLRSLDRTEADCDSTEPQIAARTEPQFAARTEPQMERSRAANGTEPGRTVAAQEQTLTVINNNPLNPPQAGETIEKKSIREGRAERQRLDDDGQPIDEADAKRLDRWDRFYRGWPWDDQELPGRAQFAFMGLADDEQAAALKNLPAYLDACRKHGRSPSQAKTWLNGKGWLALVAPKTGDYRERLAQMQREKEEAQRKRYGGVFVKAGSPQAEAWRAYELAQGTYERPELKVYGVLGTGFIRPSLWPPRAEGEPPAPEQDRAAS